ncbi:hypothetical protein JW905_12050 [bacterium]|nr:hypothetical protein [candidate division CSSED10-310 bacterium]
MKLEVYVFVVVLLACLPSVAGSVDLSHVDWQVYQDEAWGFSLEYPADWKMLVRLENFGKPSFVIKKKIEFTGPGGPMVIMDLWTNDEALELMNWYEVNYAGLMSSELQKPESPDRMVGGEPAIRMLNPQGQACTQSITLFQRGNLVFSLEYRVTDDFASLPVIEHMLATFK